MDRKLSLPLSLGSPSRRPTVDEVRKRLGGRASTEAGAGDVVVIMTERGRERVGVVLFVRGDELDVWIESGVVRRVRRVSTRPAEVAGAKAVAAVANDARAFAALVERQRVRFQHESGIGEGVLVEKCRFGGLIERSDGVMVGASFRRIWAASELEPS